MLIYFYFVVERYFIKIICKETRVLDKKMKRSARDLFFINSISEQLPEAVISSLSFDVRV